MPTNWGWYWKIKKRAPTSHWLAPLAYTFVNPTSLNSTTLKLRRTLSLDGVNNFGAQDEGLACPSFPSRNTSSDINNHNLVNKAFYLALGNDGRPTQAYVSALKSYAAHSRARLRPAFVAYGKLRRSRPGHSSRLF